MLVISSFSFRRERDPETYFLIKKLKVCGTLILDIFGFFAFVIPVIFLLPFVIFLLIVILAKFKIFFLLGFLPIYKYDLV